ncbi:MAG: amidohydrolase family protein, partial [Nitrososphaerales archaeon]
MKTRGDVRYHEVLADSAGMKLALGTDVAGFLNERKIGPNSRMGIAALLRKVLDDARRYAADPPGRGKVDLKLECMAPVVSGQLPAHVHAHEADDILTALRLAEEFGLRLVIHHATEGHLVADAIAAAGVPCVVGPITIARESARETRNLSERTPGILVARGVKVALMTDHPTEPIQVLPVIAGQAVREGMDPAEALKAITINAAEILGVADRVGSIQAGKDADLVLHEGDPLEAMTRIRIVVADGQVVYDRMPAGGAA